MSGDDRGLGSGTVAVCPDNVEEKVFFVVPAEETEARQWVIAHGYEQPPAEFCTEGTRPQVNITSPVHDETIPQGLISVRGQVQLPNFKHYDVSYGIGTDPQGFFDLLTPYYL